MEKKGRDEAEGWLEGAEGFRAKGVPGAAGMIYPVDLVTK